MGPARRPRRGQHRSAANALEAAAEQDPPEDQAADVRSVDPAVRTAACVRTGSRGCASATPGARGIEPASGSRGRRSCCADLVAYGCCGADAVIADRFHVEPGPIRGSLADSKDRHTAHSEERTVRPGSRRVPFGPNRYKTIGGTPQLANALFDAAVVGDEPVEAAERVARVSREERDPRKRLPRFGLSSPRLCPVRRR